jgi:tetratricopeptide (TPR) repeat protein
MMRKIKPLFATFLLTAGLLWTSAVYAEAGGAAAYLKMGVGARAIGMGEAYVGVAEEGIAAFWNPAGLSQVNRPQLSAMHADLNLDRKYDFINFAAPANEKVTWGVSWIHSAIEGIERRAGLNDVGYNPGDLMGYFDDKENALFGSVAFKSTDRLSLGASLKYLSHDLYQNSADGLGLDLGMLYKANQDFSVGVAIKEIGASLKWDTASGRKDDVPLNATLGFMYTPLEKVRMALDINKIEDLDTKVNFGVEGDISSAVALRAGVHDGDLTAGIGVKIKDWAMDYAFAEQELGDIHRISGSILFGDAGEASENHKTKVAAAAPEKETPKPRRRSRKAKKAARQAKAIAEKAVAVAEPMTADMPTAPAVVEPVQAAISGAGDQIMGLIELGDKALLKKDYEAAANLYKKAVALDPRQADPYFKLGNMHVVKKEMKAAREYYKMGMSINPESHYSKYARAVLETRE